MKPRRRHWLVRLVSVVRDAFAEPSPRVLKAHLGRVRRLQKRAAQQAHRNPIPTAPRALHGFEDRGFQ